MQLAVTRDTEGKTGLINLPVSEVLFLEFDMTVKWVIVHTLQDQFFVAGNLTYWVESLKAKGFDFEKVDRNVVVHMPKIKRIDRSFAYAYFEYEVGKDSKRITLAQKYFKKVLSMVDDIDPNIVIA